MPSRTSYFNPTLFRRAVLANWPIWAAYLAIWLLVLPVHLLNTWQMGWLDLAEGRTYTAGSAVIGGIIMGAVFGVIAAMALWSFLYSARFAHGFGCLPVRREALFCSAFLAGLVPMLCANLVTALLSLVIWHGDPMALLSWFGAVTLIGLFFYGFATFCAQLTGSVLVLPLVYAVLNFTAVVVEAVVRELLSGFVYGMTSGDSYSLEWLSPPVAFFQHIRSERTYILNADGTRVLTGAVLRGWGVIWAYAGVGLLLLCASLLLLRRRRMESAGDVVAVGVLRPVFRWCMALGCGIMLSALLYLILGLSYSANIRTLVLYVLIFTIIGAFVGWFGSEMLMKKTFRVFHARQWRGYGLCCVVIAAVILGMRLDLFGYERRVPAERRVSSVLVSANGESAALHAPEGVAQVLDFHRQVIADKAWNQSLTPYWETTDRSYVNLNLRYFLTNGDVMVREYRLVYQVEDPEGTGDIPALQGLLNCREAIAWRKETDFPIRRDNITSGYVESVMTAMECASAGGWDTPEDYILCEVLGYSPYEVAALSPETREQIIGETVLNNSINGGELYNAFAAPDGAAGVPASSGDLYAGAAVEWSSQTYRGYRGYGYGDNETLRGFVRSLDWNRVYFNYTITFTPAELWELYSTCVVPDIDSGALGRVWAVSGAEYRGTVYNARIYLYARQPSDREHPAGDTVTLPAEPYYPAAVDEDYDYVNFNTVPTVDSALTNAWLRSHGVPLHLVGETEQGFYKGDFILSSAW